MEDGGEKFPKTCRVTVPSTCACTAHRKLPAGYILTLGSLLPHGSHHHLAQDGDACRLTSLSWKTLQNETRTKVTQPSPHLQGWSVIINHAWEHPEMWTTPDTSMWPEGHTSQNPKKDRVRFLSQVQSKAMHLQEGAESTCRRQRTQTAVGDILTRY